MNPSMKVTQCIDPLTLLQSDTEIASSIGQRDDDRKLFGLRSAVDDRKLLRYSMML